MTCGSSTWRLGLVALGLVLAMAACGGTDGSGRKDTTTTIKLTGLQLELTLPDSMRLTSISDGSAEAPRIGCQIEAASFDYGSSFAVEAVPSACDIHNGGTGNGYHGHYRTVADVPTNPRLTALRLSIGDAQVFEQPYFECTNSCHHYTDRIAIVTLRHPTDSEHPTIVLRTDTRSLGESQFEHVLYGLSSPSG